MVLRFPDARGKRIESMATGSSHLISGDGEGKEEREEGGGVAILLHLLHCCIDQGAEKNMHPKNSCPKVQPSVPKKSGERTLMYTHEDVEIVFSKVPHPLSRLFIKCC